MLVEKKDGNINISKILQIIYKCELSYVGRLKKEYVDVLCVGFGKIGQNKSGICCEYEIHIYTDWRIKDGQLTNLIGIEDLYSNGADENIDRIRELLIHCKVIDYEVNEFFDLHLLLDNGCAIDIFNTKSQIAEQKIFSIVLTKDNLLYEIKNTGNIFGRYIG